MRGGWGLLPLAPCLAALALAPSSASAQAGRAQVQEGNRLYEQGLFQEAHQKYLEGLAAAPESAVIEFNDGNALYQGQDYPRAMEAYQRALETGDPALAGAAWYNLGNALYRQQQLEPSLEAYKQALRLRPDDVDAKHNLERVLEQLQQQEQQQDQQQDAGDPEDDQDDQQDAQEGQDHEEEDPGEPDPEEQPSQDPEEEPQEPPEGEQEDAQPSPEPGQMTPEEAQRLLDAIDEDPEEVDRRPATATGRRPRRAW